MILVDTRTKEEFNENHRSGAINIPVQNIIDGDLGILEKLPKDTEIKCYCASGSRSAIAKQILESHGFVNVYNLGGF